MSSSTAFAAVGKVAAVICPVNTVAMVAAAPKWGYLLVLAELGTLGTLYLVGRRAAERGE
ncbi:MAG: hypothetical protein KGL39_47055 [Patescibacteria group bacterium]|nr:hypothetical protein [Patescibacteria group bacterium]